MAKVRIRLRKTTGRIADKPRESGSSSNGVVEEEAREFFTKQGIEYIEQILPTKGYKLNVKTASDKVR